MTKPNHHLQDEMLPSTPHSPSALVTAQPRARTRGSNTRTSLQPQCLRCFRQFFTHFCVSRDQDGAQEGSTRRQESHGQIHRSLDTASKSSRLESCPSEPGKSQLREEKRRFPCATIRAAF